MPSLSLAALIDSKPSRPFWGRSWLEEVFARHVSGFDGTAGDRLSGWAVGAAVGGETLIQSRPVVRDRDGNLLDDLLRVEAPCTIAALHSLVADEPDKAPEMLRIARFRRFAAVQSETRFGDSLRASLQAGLPEFLRRDADRKSDAELVLYRFLASLVDRGAFGKAFAPPDAIRGALRELDACLPEEPANLFLTDGRCLAILHRVGTLLAFEPPAELRPPRRFQVDGDPHASPATLFLWSEASAATQPIAGAERIAPGVISVQIQRPGALARD